LIDIVERSIQQSRIGRSKMGRQSATEQRGSTTGKLDGKAAIVTASSEGIGAAIAKIFAAS
jgi:hypothetical protein